MRHDINIIASNYKLDKEKFREFALKYESKYGIINESGLVTTSTSFCDDLVDDFIQNQRDETNVKRHEEQRQLWIEICRIIESDLNTKGFVKTSNKLIEQFTITPNKNNETH
jgi:hypothetical protein